MSVETTDRDVQAHADRLIKALVADATGTVGATETGESTTGGSTGPEAAAYAVAVLANRAVTELHRLAKNEATARKGAPEWGNWAAFQNAARNLVLQSSTARDLAAKLAGRKR